MCGMANTGTVEVCNGWLAAVPNHPLVVACIASMRPQTSPCPSAMDIIAHSGPGHWTRALCNALAPSTSSSTTATTTTAASTTTSPSPPGGIPHTVAVLPCSYLYPLPNTMRNLVSHIDKAVYYHPHTYAVHHWACSWQGAAAATAEARRACDGETSEKNAPPTPGPPKDKDKAINAADFSRIMAIVQANQGNM